MPYPRHDESLEAEILHRDRFDAIFGQWSSFHDQYLVALRASCDHDEPHAEADFVLTQRYVQHPDGSYRPTDWYRVTLRFHDPADVSLVAFNGPAEIAELVLRREDGETSAEPRLHVYVIGHEHVGCDLDLTCSAVEVVAVEGPISWAAA